MIQLKDEAGRHRIEQWSQPNKVKIGRMINQAEQVKPLDRGFDMKNRVAILAGVVWHQYANLVFYLLC